MATSSSSFTHGTEFSIASTEDYAGVMEIDKDMYSGVDYLPEKYMDFVRDPHRVCYVGKVGSEIVAFGMSLVVDEGKTAIVQSGCVKPELRGHQISMTALIFGFSHLAKYYDIERMMWTSVDRDYSEALVQKHDNITLILERPRFSLDFSPGQLADALDNKTFHKMSQKYDVVTLTPSGVKAAMSKYPQDVASMTPQGFWVVNNEPFQPMASNYDIISRDATVFVTRSKNGLLAVSYGTSVGVKIGFRYRVDYYVRPELSEDKELFISHLMRHFKQVRQLHDGRNVSFSMWYPENMSSTGSTVKKFTATELNLHRKHTPEYPTLLLVRKLKPGTNTNSRL